MPYTYYSKYSDEEESSSFNYYLIVIPIMIMILIGAYYYFTNKDDPIKNASVLHYKAKLGYGVLSTMNTTYNASPKYLTPTVLSSTDELPKFTTYIPSRYIAIVNTGNNTINIPINSFNIYTSETRTIPVTPTDTTVVKATLSYPNIAYGRNTFVFNNISTFNGVILKDEIALIKLESIYTLNLYSISFQYTSTQTQPITLFVFNPPSSDVYNSGQLSGYTSFYQINLENIQQNNKIVIDFE